MIEFIRNDSTSINLRLDEEGNIILLNTFNKISNINLPTEIEVLMDMSVVEMKKRKVVDSIIVVERDNKINGSVLLLDDNKIVWKLDDEYIDMGIEQLSESLEKGYFSPSEFLIIKIEKNKKSDYIYAERIWVASSKVISENITILLSM